MAVKSMIGIISDSFVLFIYMILSIFSFDVFKVYLSNIDSETAEKETLKIGRGRRILL